MFIFSDLCNHDNSHRLEKLSAATESVMDAHPPRKLTHQIHDVYIDGNHDASACNWANTEGTDAKKSIHERE